MIDYLQAFWLALLQGVTEFLPISSSGHLALLPKLFGWADQGLAFDIAVHVGTLVAVVWYLRADIGLIIMDWCKSISGGNRTPHSQIAWFLLITTTITGIAGWFIEPLIERWFRLPVPIAVATIGFALLLWWFDRTGLRQREMESLSWRDAVIIGAAQILALMPGTSRSGITITAGLALGLTRTAAARFSFLMAIPVIVVVGGWQTTQLIASAAPVNWVLLLFAAMVAGVAAFACIHWFFGLLERFGMLPFVIYRLVLGAFLLLLFL